MTKWDFTDVVKDLEMRRLSWMMHLSLMKLQGSLKEGSMGPESGKDLGMLLSLKVEEEIESQEAD
jgi:hypothetical protein